MDNNKKMLPSSLPKSTELTQTKNYSTEISIMPGSREIIRAKSNIKRAKSNITPAKPNIRCNNNGGGGGGGDEGNWGPGGNDDGTTVEIFLSNSFSCSGAGSSYAQSHSQSGYSSSESFCFSKSNTNDQSSASSQPYSHQQTPTNTNVQKEQSNIINNRHLHMDDSEQHLKKNPETNQASDINNQKELLSRLGTIILVIIALQLLLGLAKTLFSVIAQISSSPLMLIVFLIAGFFLLKTHGHSLLAKNGTARKHLKAIKVKVLDYAGSKFEAFSLNTQNKGEYTLVCRQKQSK